MRKQAELVIIGAGIVGCSAAYFLSQKGWRDVVVIEQGPLFETGGSTSHAPGLVFELNASKTMGQLARWSKELYSSLALNDLPCFLPVGSLEIAYTQERFEDLQLKLGRAQAWGLPAQLVDAKAVSDKIPLLNVERIKGALHVPSDGITKATRAAEALARAAQARGTEFIGRTEVLAIEVENGSVKAVVTSQGRIETKRVLTCAGIWGPRIGRQAGVPIPLVPVEHQYVRTAPLAQLAGETEEARHPILRHQDRSMYFRQHGACYGIGSYLHEPLLVDADQIRKHKEGALMPSLRTFTGTHFEQAHKSAVELFPCFAGVELPYKINGMMSFTPDGNPLLGESLDVRGFWVAEAVWVTHGGGVGKVVAELLNGEVPEVDLRELNLHRLAPHWPSRSYVRARAAQQYREVYDIIHPLAPIENPRPLRVSPFYPRQLALGAVFFESAGWERPQWFESNSKLPGEETWPSRSALDSRTVMSSEAGDPRDFRAANANGSQPWTARHWSPIIGAEHKAVREHVGLFDLTAFTKLEVSGPNALAYLQRLTANDLDQPIGRVIYTSMLNEMAGIVCDLTVTRLEDQRFLVITGGATGQQDLAWMRSQLSYYYSVNITDLTSGRCCLGVWGPKARDLMQSLCQIDLSDERFPPYTAQCIFIGSVPALALRISYVGELGFEIYVPTEYGLYLWDILWKAGEAFGIITAGGGAFDSLRLERGYRLWGAELHTEYNPLEAGLGFAVKFDKGDFIGRARLQKIKSQGVKRKLCCFTFDNPQISIMGKEPILETGGQRVLGYVTSANYGYSVQQSIFYGYLPVDYAQPGTKVEVLFFNQRHLATVQREPLYDLEIHKLKAA